MQVFMFNAVAVSTSEVLAFNNTTHITHHGEPKIENFNGVVFTDNPDLIQQSVQRDFIRQLGSKYPPHTLNAMQIFVQVSMLDPTVVAKIAMMHQYNTGNTNAKPTKDEEYFKDLLEKERKGHMQEDDDVTPIAAVGSQHKSKLDDLFEALSQRQLTTG